MISICFLDIKFLCLSLVYICLLHVRYVPIPENVWMIDLCLLFLDTLIFWYCTSFEVFLRFCVCVWLNRRHIVLENQKENSFQKNLRFQYPPHTHPNCTPKIYIKDICIWELKVRKNLILPGSLRFSAGIVRVPHYSQK